MRSPKLLRKALTGVGALGLWLSASLADAQSPPPPEPATADPLPEFLARATSSSGETCRFHAAHRDENSTWVACGPAGVWEVRAAEDGTLSLVRTYDAGGDAVGIFPDPQGRLWVETTSVSARPLSQVRASTASNVATWTPPPSPAPAAPAATPQPTPAPQPSAPAPAGPPVGSVVAVSPGRAVIDLGSEHNIRRGIRIEISRPVPSAVGDSPYELAAIGEVVAVAPSSSTVQLGVDESVPLGAVATPTRAAITGGLVAPPRPAGIWQLEVMGRPFVALDALGGGVLLDAGIGYRFASNLRLAALLSPVGFGDVEGQDAIGVANGMALVSFDSRYLEMGVGLGAQTVSDPSFPLSPGSGLTVGQIARIGALDGLNLTGRSTVVLFHRRFDFGSLVINGQIPVGRGYWLLMGGGGGPVGYGYGEIGLRVLLGGNGGHGSTFLRATAGGAGVFRSKPCTTSQFGFECGGQRSYVGPMVGFGGEWRF
jgi:hypothetical protein